MRLWPFALLVWAAGQPPVTTVEQSAFVLGAAPDEYEMHVAGLATRPDGATLTIKATSSGLSRPAAITGSVPAQAFRGGRMRLSGELLTREAACGASLWMRIDDGDTMLLLENGLADAQRGTTEWTAREVSLPVPPTASRIAFGLLLQGPGQATVRA